MQLQEQERVEVVTVFGNDDAKKVWRRPTTWCKSSHTLNTLSLFEKELTKPQQAPFSVWYDQNGVLHYCNTYCNISL